MITNTIADRHDAGPNNSNIRHGPYGINGLVGLVPEIGGANLFASEFPNNLNHAQLLREHLTNTFLVYVLIGVHSQDDLVSLIPPLL